MRQVRDRSECESRDDTRHQLLELYSKLTNTKTDPFIQINLLRESMSLLPDLVRERRQCKQGPETNNKDLQTPRNEKEHTRLSRDLET